MRFRAVYVGAIIFSAVAVSAAALWYRHSDDAAEHGRTAMFAGKEYALEIADSDDERSLGLGERDSLCGSCAMLFTFDRPGRYAFWMKGMRFPIDIVWLSGDEVVHVERNIPADSRAIYAPAASADRVLELNAGEAEELSLHDRIRLSL